MGSCGDKQKENAPPFDPETEWVSVTAASQTDIGSGLMKLYNRYLKPECPAGHVCPTDPGAGPFFRNVRITGDLAQLRGFSDPLYAGIYNLDLSGTKLREMLYGELPAAARSVTLPSTLVDMGAGFAGCTELISMEIPAGVQVIHDYNFSGLDRLRTVTLAAATPPDILYAQDMEGGSASHYPKIYPSPSWTLTVPAGAKQTYEQHEWWGRFSTIAEK